MKTGSILGTGLMYEVRERGEDKHGTCERPVAMRKYPVFVTL